MMGQLAEHRTIAAFNKAVFEPMMLDGEPLEGSWWHNISYDDATGQGSYLMIMAPGAKSNPHRHNGPEEFYMVEGDLVDCDGTTYRAGDFISLSGGSAHDSHSPSGCKIVVTHRGVVDNISKSELEALT